MNVNKLCIADPVALTIRYPKGDWYRGLALYDFDNKTEHKTKGQKQINPWNFDHFFYVFIWVLKVG